MLGIAVMQIRNSPEGPPPPPPLLIGMTNDVGVHLRFTGFPLGAILIPTFLIHFVESLSLPSFVAVFLSPDL